MLLKINNGNCSKQLIVYLVLAILITPIISVSSPSDESSKFSLLQSDDKISESRQEIPENKPFKPGDAVRVSAFPDTSSFLNQIFPIDDRGFVELPIYGKVKITDMSEQELVDFLKQKFRDYLRYPYLRVKPMIRVSILGGVPKPGFYYFDPDNSLWELVHVAGGTIDEDGLKKMKWKRDREDVKDNLIPYIQKGTSFNHMGFKSGDQIWVRTPGKPSGIQKFFQTYSPIITFATSMVSISLTYYFLFRFGETRRVGGGGF